MAMRPTTINEIEDIIAPALMAAGQVHGVAIKGLTSYILDCIMVYCAKDEKVYSGILLTRSEIDNGNWIDIVSDRMDKAIAAVMPQASEDIVSEYDEIMQAQAVMAELKP